jgi:signal transduction histidine kinase
MNGSLFCYSTVGQGSTFIAEFPLVKSLLHTADSFFA